MPDTPNQEGSQQQTPPTATQPGQAAEESEGNLVPNQPVVAAPGQSSVGPVPEHQQSQPGQAFVDARYAPNLDDQGNIVEGEVKALTPEEQAKQQETK